MSQALIWAAGGTGFTFLMTTLGAAMVFLFRGEINMKIQRVFLGFAAGVMIAASVWSLLIPAINEAEKAGGIGWIPAAGGFVLGILSAPDGSAASPSACRFFGTGGNDFFLEAYHASCHGRHPAQYP